jgi:hypothetical protein
MFTFLDVFYHHYRQQQQQQYLTGFFSRGR